MSANTILEPRYHTPRSQVWEGSRGRQRGHVHLHVTSRLVSGRLTRHPGGSLCGNAGWYEQAGRRCVGETFCPRCVEVADRHGLTIPEVER